MARKRYLIIGDGAAGLTAAECLREADPSATIGLFSDEPVPGYYRAALTNYLLGELREDQLWAVAPDFYDKHGIRRIYARVLGVDAAGHRLWCSAGPDATGYDQLLVASGARSRPPSFPGAEFAGVLTLRSLADARQVVDRLRLGRLGSAVVLGGGALGLEWAHALLEHGVKVTLLERASRFLPNALDQVASDLLAARLRRAGVEVVLGDEVVQAHPGPQGGVQAVTTRGGRQIPCELVAAALGVLPNAEFLASAGATLAPNGAIVVDRQMRSSLVDVFAAGDVASVEGECLSLWEPARRQARVAADGMLGRPAQYAPGVHYFATRLFDLDFARLGRLEGPGGEEIVDFPRGTGQIAYRKLALSGGKLVGALMIGERALRVRAIGRNLKRLIDSAVDVSAVTERLLDPGFDVEAWLGKGRIAQRAALATGTEYVAAAQLKKTHAISLSAALAGGTRALAESTRAPLGSTRALAEPGRAGARADPGRGGTLAVASQQPRQTRLLSIGLVAEAPPAAAPGAAPIDARLEGGGRAFALTGPITNLGRAPDCQLVLNDSAVSSLHAQISRHGDALYLRDLGSRTGTWLNGRPLSEAHALVDGDRVALGQCEFVFRSSAPRPEAAAAQPTGPAPRLEVRSGAAIGLGFALGSGRLLIGSGAECALRLSDPSLSPRHAELHFDGRGHVLTDLGSASGTFARGVRLPPGQPLGLSEGELVRLGAVDLLYTSAARDDLLSRLKPGARLCVDSGSERGKSVQIRDRVLVGSGPRAALRLESALPEHLELAENGGRFWVRDLSGGRAFRAGSPLGAEFSELNHGDLLLLGGSTLLRFEESP